MCCCHAFQKNYLCQKARQVKFFFRILFSIGFFSAVSSTLQAQYTSVPTVKKNFLVFNLGQYAVNEINLGFERMFGYTRSVEINLALIYRNDFLAEQAREWSNTQYFVEHGFALRAGYKMYQPGERGGNQNYLMPMLNYQYLYYPTEWFVTDVKVNNLTEEIYQRRTRHRIGAQFIWGKIFPAGNVFSFELFYGVGVRAVFSNRYDESKRYSELGSDVVFPVNFRDKKFYLRPSVHAGIKMRVGW